MMNEDNVEASEWKPALELLKAMLTMDANERITPSEVLTHPFITGQPFEGEPSASAPRDDGNTHSDHRSPSPSIPPGVIMVQPDTPENSLQLEDEENADR